MRPVVLRRHYALAAGIFLVLGFHVGVWTVQLAGLAGLMPNVDYIDLRGTVRENEWWDELHPKESASRRLADKFRARMGPPNAAAATTRKRKRQTADA